jgi:hypothetical protein
MMPVENLGPVLSAATPGDLGTVATRWPGAQAQGREFALRAGQGAWVASTAALYILQTPTGSPNGTTRIASLDDPALQWETLSGGGGTCPLTLIERKVVSVETTALTFNSGLNGDADGIYQFLIRGIGGSTSSGGASTMRIQFNGDGGANHYKTLSDRQFGIPTPTSPTAQTGATGTSILSAVCGGPGLAWSCEGTILPKTGVQRLVQGVFSNYDPSDNADGAGRFWGAWTDTVSLLSEIDFFCPGIIFGVGTEAYLWKQATS